MVLADRSTGCPWGCRFYPIRQRHGDVRFDRKQYWSDRNSTGEVGEASGTSEAGGTGEAGGENHRTSGDRHRQRHSDDL